MEPGKVLIGVHSPKLRIAIAAVGLFALVILSMRFLYPPYYGYIWELPFSGWDEILPITGWAALRVWTFWALATVVIGGGLLRGDPELGLFDALFGGAAGAWMFAYVVGNLLGPLGMFRGWTIWAL